MTQIELEYQLNTSPSLLFTRLSTASGLAEWFADNVEVAGKKFTFIWNNSEMQAELISSKANEFVRFKWLDNEMSNEFEFRIVIEEITGGLALIVIDEIDEDDRDDVINLWDSSVSKLKLATGS